MTRRTSAWLLGALAAVLSGVAALVVLFPFSCKYFDCPQGASCPTTCTNLVGMTTDEAGRGAWLVSAVVVAAVVFVGTVAISEIRGRTRGIPTANAHRGDS